MGKSTKVVLFFVSLHLTSQVSCMKNDTSAEPSAQNEKIGPDKQNWEDTLKKILSQLPRLKIVRRDENKKINPLQINECDLFFEKKSVPPPRPLRPPKAYQNNPQFDDLKLLDISPEPSSEATKNETEGFSLIGSITTVLHNLFSYSVEEKN